MSFGSGSATQPRLCCRISPATSHGRETARIGRRAPMYSNSLPGTCTLSSGDCTVNNTVAACIRRNDSVCETRPANTTDDSTPCCRAIAAKSKSAEPPKITNSAAAGRCSARNRAQPAKNGSGERELYSAPAYNTVNFSDGDPDAGYSSGS